MSKELNFENEILGNQNTQLKQIDPNDIPEDMKELILCECGNHLFDQKVKWHKLKNQKEPMYFQTIANICSKCKKELPENP